MAAFHPYQLAPVEVAVLITLLGAKKPLTRVSIVRALPDFHAEATARALVDLAGGGYIVRATPKAYSVHPDRLALARVQAVLGGAVDDFNLLTWIMAAVYLTWPDSPAGVTAGQIFEWLRDRGKEPEPGEIRGHLDLLVGQGLVTTVDRRGLRFYCTDTDRRRRIVRLIRTFPALPAGANPVEDVYRRVRALGRPMQAREIMADFGGIGLDCLADLINWGRLLCVPPAPGAEWGPDAVVYLPPIALMLAEAAPAGQTEPPPAPDAEVLTEIGMVGVYKLAAAEVKVLLAVLGRKTVFSAYVVSRSVFGDTPFANPPTAGPAAAGVATTNLQASPILKSLVNKGLLTGRPAWEAGTTVACRHDARSYYTPPTWRQRVRAAAMLLYTTGKPYCVCGNIRQQDDYRCPACLKAVNQQYRPAPGETPIPPADLPYLHAVHALTNPPARPRAKLALVVAFLDLRQPGPAGGAADRWQAAHQALTRLERSGYITRNYGNYSLDDRQRAWVAQAYPTDQSWPHLAPSAPLAAGTAERAGRGVELD